MEPFKKDTEEKIARRFYLFLVGLLQASFLSPRRQRRDTRERERERERFGAWHADTRIQAVVR